MRRVCLLAGLGVGLLSCGEPRASIRVPGDDAAYFILRGQAATRTIDQVEGPFLRDEPAPLELTFEEGSVLAYLGLDGPRLGALGSRLDSARLSELRIDPSTDQMVEDVRCREASLTLRDGEGKTRGVELALGRVLGHASVAVFDRSEMKLLPSLAFPLDAAGWSLRGPIDECLPGLEIQVRPFVPGARSFVDFGTSEVILLDESTILLVGGRGMALFRRDEAEPIAEWIPEIWEEEGGYWIEVADAIRTAWPDHVDIFFFANRALGTSIGERVLYVMRYDSSGFSEPREIFRHRGPSTQSSRGLEIRENGEILISGNGILVSGSSTSGPFLDHQVGDLSFTRAAWTRRPEKPLILGDYAGALWSGRPERGVETFEYLDLFGDYKPVFAVAEDTSAGAVYVASDSSRFKTDLGGEWVELRIGVGDEALACAFPEQAVCGLRELRESGGRGIRKLALAKPSADRTLLVFAPENCTGLFVADPAAGCARAAPLYGEQVEFAGRELSFRMDWGDEHGVIVRNTGEILDLRVRMVP